MTPLDQSIHIASLILSILLSPASMDHETTGNIDFVKSGGPSPVSSLMCAYDKGAKAYTLKYTERGEKKTLMTVKPLDKALSEFEVYLNWEGKKVVINLSKLILNYDVTALRKELKTINFKYEMRLERARSGSLQYLTPLNGGLGIFVVHGVKESAIVRPKQGVE